MAAFSIEWIKLSNKHLNHWQHIFFFPSPNHYVICSKCTGSLWIPWKIFEILNVKNRVVSVQYYMSLESGRNKWHISLCFCAPILSLGFNWIRLHTFYQNTIWLRKNVLVYVALVPHEWCHSFGFTVHFDDVENSIHKQNYSIYLHELFMLSTGKDLIV